MSVKAASAQRMKCCLSLCLVPNTLSVPWIVQKIHKYSCFFLGKPTNTPCDFNSLSVSVSLLSFKQKGEESRIVIISITNINYPAI